MYSKKQLTVNPGNIDVAEEIADASAQQSNKKRIKRNRPKPIDKESPFQIDELFFSVTEPDSRIRYVNDTFIRISGYDKDELLGSLHNKIRHPDMPRAVFKIMWDYLLSGKPMAAYVKNMAKDGSYYWVMAMVFPCNGGYLSIRLKPSSNLFPVVNELYKEILAYENKQELKTNKRKALDLTESFVLKQLNKLGYGSYDEFMWHALGKEMLAREKYLNIKEQHKHNTDDSLNKLMNILGQLLQKTEVLTELQQQLIAHSDYLLKLAKTVSLLSINAQIGSSKLDQKYQYISVVAENMSNEATVGEKRLTLLQNIVTELNTLMDEINFNVISSKLQMEMAIDFTYEMNNPSRHLGTQLLSDNDCLSMLHSAYKPHITSIMQQIDILPTKFHHVYTGVTEINRFMHTLRFIHVTGIIEVSRLDDTNNSFANTFNELIRQIEFAENKMKDLTEFLNSNQEIAQLLYNYQLQIKNIQKSNRN